MYSQTYSSYKASDRRGSDSSSGSTFVGGDYFALSSGLEIKSGCTPATVKLKDLILRALQITVEGYRTLGVVSTFIAGVESQCLGMVTDVKDSPHPRVIEAASALLLTGLLLSSFGAALALLAARWFDLLKDEEVEILELQWSCARRQRKCTKGSEPDNESKSQIDVIIDGHEKHWKDFLVAKAVSATLFVVFRQVPFSSCLIKRNLRVLDNSGFITFVAAMVLYSWVAHRLATAIVTTVIAVLGTCLIVTMHLDFEFKGTLRYMSFERIRI
ncbi:hypothetical protein RHS02_06653, partial [Rhizoctonia solani]